MLFERPQPPRRFPGAAVVVLPVFWLFVVGGDHGGTTTAEALMTSAFRVQVRDFEALRNYSFHRQVRRERLDRKGAVVWRQTFTLLVTPRDEGFDEFLLEIDGRSPTQKEVEEHRSSARFSKHFRELISGRSENPLVDESLSLPAVLRSCTYELVGSETVDGFASHRLTIRPQAPRRASKVQTLADAMEGTVWLTTDGLHILRWESRLVRPVRQGPVKVKKYDLTLKTLPRQGIWLVREIHISTELSLFGVPMRKRNAYRYSGFQGDGGFAEDDG